MKQILMKELNNSGNLTEVWEICNKTYMLPKNNTKAWNVPYAQAITFYDPENPKVFLLKREHVIYRALPPTNGSPTIPDLLALLDQILKKQNLPPSGMTIKTPPDMEWLLRTIQHLDPQNTFKVFGDTVSMEETIMRSVNPEFIYIH